MNKRIIFKNSRQRSTIENLMISGIRRNETKETIINSAFTQCEKLNITENFSGGYNEALAVLNCIYAIAQAKISKVDTFVLLTEYAKFKKYGYYVLGDKGSFGDLVEVLTRICTKPKNLLHYSDIHVKASGKTDIKLRGQKCEVGHNGKTFNDSIFDEPMHNIDIVVYGVIDADEREAIFDYCINGNIKKALETISDMLYVFTAEQFENFMTKSVGRSSKLVYKPHLDKYQVIYNDSMHSAFIDSVYDNNIETLAEYLSK